MPRFVRRYATLADDAVAALERFFLDVEKGTFPGAEESYQMSEEAARALFTDERAWEGEPSAGS